VSRVSISAIQEVDLPLVGRFLNENLNAKIPAAAWVNSLVHPWSASRPNFGFKAQDDDRLVGVFCAIYSDQVIDGRREVFCNPHSWCMLDDYRSQSVGLPLRVIKQPGYHFTMLTPNPRVAEIFLRLGFRKLDDAIVVFPNLPSPAAAFGAQVVCTEPKQMSGCLPDGARRDFEAHRAIPWLQFVAFGKGSDVCLVVYKRGRWKRLPCARILGISDPEAFDRHLHLMQHRLLLEKGLLVSRVERRFLVRRPRFAHSELRMQAKLCLSSSLRDSQISDLYSELVALDL
jgi:hypothetical protein